MSPTSAAPAAANPFTEQSYTAGVRVMRSYDYSHFEVSLSTSEPLNVEGVDALRKEAARLVDKAVEQYKIAKSVEFQALDAANNRNWYRKMAEQIRQIPENERTPEQKATLKTYEDHCFRADRRYNYEDEGDAGEVAKPEPATADDRIIDRSYSQEVPTCEP